MAFSDTGNMLVAAKAVSDTYPLRGEVIIADQPFIRGAPIVSGPPPGEVWLESRALPALGIDVGDSVFVGVLGGPVVDSVGDSVREGVVGDSIGDFVRNSASDCVVVDCIVGDCVCAFVVGNCVGGCVGGGCVGDCIIGDGVGD